MKLTTALLLLTCFQVSAKVFSQNNITLRLQSTELKKVLSIIERKSSYRFLYTDETVKNGVKVDVEANNTPVTDVLDKLFANRLLSYKILENNLVVITNRNMEVTETKVSGKITSSTGEVLPGVTVSVKGSSLGTQTDAAGNFTLTVPDNAVLVISYVGYVSQEIPVTGRTSINISLVASTQKMDEVVVIGYGTASKRDLTGSIVKVLGKDIADKPNTNPVSSLQAKVAGLSVVNDGRPGEDPDIRIRGTISIGSVHPLYVVDGILNDDIKFLNPNDIESIEVLKDPSSLAIFGVRGAAGVIIVTTKKAKAGQITVNVNSTFGAKKLVDAVKVADGPQFKLLLNEEANNRIIDNAGDLGLRSFYDTHISKWTGNTDWQKAITRTAIFNTNNVSVSGASEKNKFYMGVGYTKDQGLVKHVQLEKIQLSINDEYKVNNIIKVGFTLNTSKEKLPFDANGQFSDARRIAPVVQPYFPEQDLYSTLPNIQNTLSNPLMQIDYKYNANPKDRYRVVGSIFAEVNILKNLTARATWYGDWTSQRDVLYTPIFNAYNPDGANNTPSIDKISVVSKVSDDRYDTKKWQQDYVLTYKKNFGAHSLTATYGFETYFKSYNKLHGQVEQKSNGDPIPNDKRFWNIDNGFGDPSSKVSSSAQYEQATASHLARVLYSYQGKYFFNASFRRDGSYAFFKNGNTWDNFYAFGAAWNLAKENFMASQTFFNEFKLKGSWGLLGNQSTYDENNNYPLYPALLNNTSPIFGQFVYPAYSQAYLPFGDLHWEHVKAMEAGFEFQAINNKLHFEALYYKKKTEGFLVQVPGIAGATGGLGNTGDIENKGFEFSASWNQNITKDLSFTVSGNLSTIKNKVLALSNTGYKLAAGETNPNQTEAGYPIGYFYGFVTDGVYQTPAELTAVPVSLSGGTPAVGDLRFKDVNGDKKITDDDRTIIGNPTPKFTYGGSVGINYKNFNLGVDVGGVSGNQIYRIWGISENQFSLYNYAIDKLDRWHGAGTSNTIPILNNGRKINRLPSTLGIESGSYFRIRNLQLGYNLPAQLLTKVNIKMVRVFVNVQNLKTFKKNAGYSPEFGGTAQTAAISFGLDNADAQGALPRIFTGGVSITF